MENAMRVLSQYLLACAAACFIALGSGFVSLFDPTIQYERDAYALAFQIEQRTGLPAATQKIDCTETGEAFADCKLARHLVENSNAFLELFEDLF